MSDESRNQSRRYECALLIVGAIVCLVCLPFVVLALILFRPIVVLAGVGVVIASCVYALRDPQTRARLCAAVWSGIDTYRGIRLARVVAIDRGHSWAIADDEVIVGADDLVQALLGPIDDVRLPAEGSRVERGQPLFRLRHGDRSISLPSPVSGTVVGVNEALREHPDLVNNSPFENGWVALIHADHLREDRERLLMGRDARNWMHEQVDSVLGILPSARDDDHLCDRIDRNAWDAVCAQISGAREPAA